MIPYSNYVFHGTTTNHISSLEDGIKFSECNQYTDFGKGFYVTKDFKQAKAFAKKLADQHNRLEAKKRSRNKSYVVKRVQGIVLTYEVDIVAWNALNGRCFERSTDSWRKFVYNNRISKESMRFSDETHNQASVPEYDIVQGPLADGQMADLTQVETGELLASDFLKTVTNIGSQISIHTDAAKSGLKLLPDRRYFA